MKHLILLLCVFLSAISAFAGGFSMGTEFYFTFTENLHQGEPQSAQQLTVFIAASHKTKGNIELLGAGTSITWSHTFTVDSMHDTEITIPSGFNSTAEIQELADEQPLRHAIHVVTDNPVLVYGLNHIQYTADGFLAIPLSVWGTSYRIGSYAGSTRISADPNIRATSEFALVSAYDNTKVNIVLSDNSMAGPSWGISHAVGTVVNVTLMKGEVYQMQSWKNGSEPSDFSGTIISSNHPVGLIAGAKCADVPITKPACDYIVEMLPPITTWGTEYFTYPFEPARPAGDMWRVFATQPGTQVVLNGTLIATIYPSDPVNPFFETDNGSRPELKQAALWAFNKPVMMCQYLTGQTYDGSDHGDPSSVVLEPREQFQRDAMLVCPSSGFGYVGTYVNIVVDDSMAGRRGWSDSVLIDGFALYAATTPNVVESSSQVPGTSYRMFHVKIPPGVHHITAQTDFSTYVVGFKDFESFAWPGAMSLNVIPIDTLPPVLHGSLRCGELFDTIQDAPLNANVWGLAQFADDGRGIGWLHGTPPNNTSNFDDAILVPADSGNAPGDAFHIVHIKVTNPLQDAYGALYLVDRVGNNTTHYFRYATPVVDCAPSADLFGAVSPQSTKIDTVTIRNGSTGAIALDSIWLKSNTVFHILSTPPLQKGIMSVNESFPLAVQYSPANVGDDEDSIVGTFECLTIGLGKLSGTSKIVGIGAGVASPTNMLVLRSIAPNPADATHVTGSVDINYALGSRSPVMIEICNILGQDMLCVDAGMRGAGEWRESVDISRLAPGAYVVRLAAGRDMASRMLMVR